MIDLEMKRKTNNEFLKKACDIKPVLKENLVYPEKIVEIIDKRNGNSTNVEKNNYIIINTVNEICNIDKYELKRNDKLQLDFGEHQVGYVTLKLKAVGSPQDSPAFIKIKFGEIAAELLENSDDYDGWISRSWIQEEYLHIDVLPETIVLPRRYAFRFMEIKVIDTSVKWQLVIEEVSCRSVSAGDIEEVTPIVTENERYKKLDKVSIRTLQNCMHSVFEDGPKRDRRLWIGDLRLQAKANYVTFKNYNLVKRCLYLFAGLTRDDGRVGACLFIEPEYLVDNTFFFDYSMFFAPILNDYYKETNDKATVKELWNCAYTQLQLAKKEFNRNNLINDGEVFTCFIDWKAGLNKQAAAQGVYIYCLKSALEIANVIGDDKAIIELQSEINIKTIAALEYLWDNEQQLFISGKERQLSYASQVWMILAGVINKEIGSEVLNKIMTINPEQGMVTPYMNHHFVEALLICGQEEKAEEYMNYYWGGMLEEGADTFWELYNPRNPNESPYGSSMVNSYCHAWSCTPTYFIRKYFLKQN